MEKTQPEPQHEQAGEIAHQKQHEQAGARHHQEFACIDEPQRLTHVVEPAVTRECLGISNHGDKCRDAPDTHRLDNGHEERDGKHDYGALPLARA